ncbi:MAG: MTH1187 family thiamine-binding protein [Spirochaetes bacterium]|nr:MTH1187 family thiamine-binding protein [Spirochaetota bacterium]
MSAIADLTIFPLDKGESVSSYVAEAVKVVQTSGLEYQIGPMSTCFEGDWDTVIRVVKDCMDVMNNECSRVYMVLKVDYRSGIDHRMKGKVESLNRILDEK